MSNLFLKCTGKLTSTSKGYPKCSKKWIQAEPDIDKGEGSSNEIFIDLTPVDQLNETLLLLFSWDGELFSIVLFGCCMLFSLGWGAGVVLRQMSRNMG